MPNEDQPEWMATKEKKEKSSRIESLERQLVQLREDVKIMNSRMFVLAVGYDLLISEDILDKDLLDEKLSKLGFKKVQKEPGEEDSGSNEEVPETEGVDVLHNTG